jgi:hypothetical protein
MNESCSLCLLHRSCQVDLRASTSSIVIEPACSNTIEISSSPKMSTGRSRSVTTVDLLNQTSSPKISHEIRTIDQNQADYALSDKALESTFTDSWMIPISDDVDAALEQVLNQIDDNSDTSMVFSPATARRTETAVMVARLPKIPLKAGRFRSGRPVQSSPPSTTVNVYRPAVVNQSSPSTMLTTTSK